MSTDINEAIQRLQLRLLVVPNGIVTLEGRAREIALAAFHDGIQEGINELDALREQADTVVATEAEAVNYFATEAVRMARLGSSGDYSWTGLLWNLVATVDEVRSGRQVMFSEASNDDKG